MRVIVDIELKEPRLLKDYRPALVSLLKTALTYFEGGRFFEQYFAIGADKNYAAAVMLIKPQFVGDWVELQDNRIRLIWAAADLRTVFVFSEAFRAIKGKEVPMNRENTLTVVGVKTVEEPVLQGNLVEFKILSPICLRVHQREGNGDWYVSAEALDFAEVLKENLYRQMEQYDARLAPLVEALKVNTGGCRKTVVWAYGQAIEATVGRIAFYGDPALLNALLVSGIGSRRPSFFGLLEAQRQEVWQ